ncbi:MAG: aldolase catalytic domain-containing protein [Lachnospiraceae bacterium]|nr:aldolase catalytic domain-containing protein [Lachnospiraceae bacterium]
MGEIQLLDCTLRDGGYINDWAFGHNNMVTIYERLVSAGIDIIEIGFLDDRRVYDWDRSILPDTESVEKTYGSLDRRDSMIVGMIDYGTCDISHVQDAQESFLDGIRVIFKKEKMHGAIAFCAKLKEKGYRVFSQAVSITSYSDAEFKELTDLVNDLEPYAFSLVDTYGLLHKQQLAHYFTMADEQLKETIGLGYHAHNNFQLAYANCIEVLETKLKRMLIVDGTLYGMGKSAGNAPTELLAMYMNEHNGKQYHMSQLLEAIDVTMLDLYRQMPWGYQFKFFLSASNDCHPNYVTYLQQKNALSVKSINEILSRIEPAKKLLYDAEYIERLYLDYQVKDNDDAVSYAALTSALAGRDVLIMAPGPNLMRQKEQVKACAAEKGLLTMAVNIVPEAIEIVPDYLFLSNSKRYVQMATAVSRLQKNGGAKIIATSNVTSSADDFDIVLNYRRLLNHEAQIRENPLFFLLDLMKDAGAHRILLAGFDGYQLAAESNYVHENMEYSFTKEKAEAINDDVRRALAASGLMEKITFVTDSVYSVMS